MTNSWRCFSIARARAQESRRGARVASFLPPNTLHAEFLLLLPAAWDPTGLEVLVPKESRFPRGHDYFTELSLPPGHVGLLGRGAHRQRRGYLIAGVTDPSYQGKRTSCSGMHIFFRLLSPSFPDLIILFFYVSWR